MSHEETECEANGSKNKLPLFFFLSPDHKYGVSCMISYTDYFA